MRVRELQIDSLVRRWPHIHLDQFDDVIDSHGNPRSDSLDNMDVIALDMLEKTVCYAYNTFKWDHLITSGYRREDTKWHGKGKAIDIKFFKKKLADVSMMEQWAMALRFNWAGIGFYLNWSTPGLHLDMRTGSPYRAMWYQDVDSRYKDVVEFLKNNTT